MVCLRKVTCDKVGVWKSHAMFLIHHWVVPWLLHWRRIHLWKEVRLMIVSIALKCCCIIVFLIFLTRRWIHLGEEIELLILSVVL